jgi:PAS domain S-box-containing protein
MALDPDIIPPQCSLENNPDTDDESFRRLVESTSAAIFIYQGMRLIYVNPAAENLTGYTSQELVGIMFNELFPGQEKKRIRKWATKVLRGVATSSHDEFRIITKTGEEHWIDISTAKIKYNNQQATIGTAFDITDQKRGEVLQDAVYSITKAADNSNSLEELFSAVHSIISKVMKVANFYIALYDSESNLLSFPYFVDEVDVQPGPSTPGKGLTEYVLRTGKSYLIDLAVHDELCRLGEIELVGVPSPIWLGVPLIVASKVIGAMVVQHYSDPNAYTVREKRILEFVSSQVATAINRKQSEEIMRESEERYHRRADELAALYETGRDLATQQDLQTLLNTIADRVTNLMRSPGCTIYLYDEERKELEGVISRGLPEMIGIRLKMGEGIAGRVAETLKPMVIEDHRKWAGRSPKFANLNAIAVAEVPMVYSGRLIGVLTVYEIENGENAQIRKYVQADIDLLTVFADTAAVAVNNARLHEETGQRLLELEILYQTSLAATQIHSSRAVAQQIVDTIDKLLDWNSSIWLVNDTKPSLLAHCSKGMAGVTLANEFKRIDGLITSLDLGVIGQVCKNGSLTRIGNIKNISDIILTNDYSQSVLCVPLKSGPKTIGCINVESQTLDAFSDHDERLLNTLANQAAVAIENARLFEETHRRAVHQAALNSIITVSAHSGLDPAEILNTTLDQTLKALDLEMGSLWLSWSSRGIQRIASKNLPQSIISVLANAAVTAGFSQRQTLVIDDWRNQSQKYSELFVSLGICSIIVVPLLSKENRIGGLAVASLDTHKWTTEEISLVEAIAREIGSAAERAKLFEETTVRLDELEAVNKVSKSLRLAQSLHEMLPLLMDETLKILGVKAGGIWLYNSDRDKLCQLFGRGWCTQIANLELDRDESLPGKVFSTGDIYFSHDVAQDSFTSKSMGVLVPPDCSAICLPIHSEQEPIGVLLASTELPREFTIENAHLLVTLTEIAGNAIHRTRLSEKMVQHASELELRVSERTAELQSALKKSQAADRLKSEFIINVNHELRTPLTNLVLYYQMLRSQPTVKSEERLDVIGRELQRLRTLIEELLNLSRFDLGQVKHKFVQFDLNSLVQTLINDRRSLAEDRGLTLILNLQPDLELVWLDEQTITQAISNLLTNAMNYTPRGGKITAATIKEIKLDETWVGFRIQDTGHGIDAEDLPHLFERFYRGKAGHNSGAPGTGLGLAIVKQVVDHHHGRIEVENCTKEKGAMFTIWLPYKKEQETN